MAFKSIRPRAAVQVKAPVVFSCFRSSGQFVSALRVSQVVIDRLGWKVGDRVEVALGEGDDEGILRMAKTVDGGFKLSKPGSRKGVNTLNGARIILRALSDNRRHESSPVEYEIQEKENALYVTLPDWLKGDTGEKKHNTLL